MGSLRRKTSTRPLPGDAERFERKGQRFVRWLDRTGKKRTGRVTTGNDGTDRVVIEAATYTAKYRDSDGVVREVSTGCRDKQAAQAILTELERQAERTRAGIVTDAENAAAVHAASTIAGHLESYLRSLSAAGRSHRHVTDTDRLARTIVNECHWRTLRDIDAEAAETWLDERRRSDMAARTRNSYLQALRGFCQWCMRNNRLIRNPLATIQKADEKADRRKLRRAMTEDELRRLLFVARWRPLAEYGRESVPPKSKEKLKRSNWNKKPLEFDDITAAVERARERLSDNPGLIAELELRGRERALIYKTLVLTGLRANELRTLTVGQVYLDEATPFVELDAADEKSREGSSIPLRGDLADDIRDWLELRLRVSFRSMLRIRRLLTPCCSMFRRDCCES